jgi:uncharacterized protein (DUF1330 family)
MAPGEANLAAFSALPSDQPIHMLNFLRYRDKAEYPAGHENAEKGWSGARAYEEYGRAIIAPFTRAGARIVWRGAFGATTIGPADEQWDDLLIVQYPSAEAFFGMISDPEYQAGAVNRTAALSDSRLYRTAPGTPLV